MWENGQAVCSPQRSASSTQKRAEAKSGEWETSLLSPKCQLSTLAGVCRELLRLANSSPATADLKMTKSQVGPDVFISHRGKGVCRETPREYPHRERQQCLGNWKETFTCNPGQMEPVPNALGQAGMITILERSNDVYLHTCHFQNKYHTNFHKSTQLLFFISHISPIRCNCT